MYVNAPYTVIQRAMHIHPTITEVIPTMLGELKSLESTSPKNICEFARWTLYVGGSSMSLLTFLFFFTHFARAQQSAIAPQ
jgi:hypothetical protein